MIERVKIMRVEQAEDGTFGVLLVNGQAWCVTLEPPDKGNQKNISCIPAGEYICRRVVSNRFGQTFEITDVHGRTHILFHPGNVIADTKGCVLPGRFFGEVRGDRGVMSSGFTFQAFMAVAEGVDEFPLTIEDSYREAA